MPTQRGMSSFTGWKRQADEPMKEKKDRERFSIKFNENDPAHDAVIRLLEKQGPHSKAQFIVNAVLHYINCPETPDNFPAQKVDRAFIEKIVVDILRNRDNGQRGEVNGLNSIKIERVEQESTKSTESRCDIEPEQREISENTRAMIADTMSAFRSS